MSIMELLFFFFFGFLTFFHSFFFWTQGVKLSLAPTIAPFVFLIAVPGSRNNVITQKECSEYLQLILPQILNLFCPGVMMRTSEYGKVMHLQH